MTQPHIGINLLHVHPALAGVRVYAAHFVESLAWSWPEAKITIFVGYGGLEALQATYDDIARLPNIEVETLDVDPRRKFALFYHENTTLAQRVRATGVDFLASLDYHQPLSIRPSAFVVHDLNYIDVGEGLPRSYRLLRKLVIPVCARRSSQIWTISPFTQARMAEHYPQFAAKTHMVGSGVPQDSPALTPLPDFDATTPYLLSVGTFNPNKNYDRLAAAFEKLDWDGKLVIVGKRGPASDNPLLQKMRERLGDRLEIHDAGVSDTELAWLYANAAGYVSASLYEGYGLTLLEGMRAGVPVASSDRASLPYVGGNAALYFNPEDINDMRAALHRLLLDTDLRATLVQNGKKRISEQSWINVSRRVREMIENDLLKK